jgi:DNA repair exonuclease SbcCD ATPase subunit
MWIERVSLENFLSFSSASVDFAPGLNVVLSPNEGGKSSLFRGIVTALFVDSSSKSSDIKALARWGSDSLFKIELELELGGERIRLVRDFATKAQMIYRAGEATPAAKGKAVDLFLRERLPLADQHLFLRVCGVRHEELALVSGGPDIGERIEEILGGGRGEVTPAALTQTLESKRRELLKGKDRPVLDLNAGPVRRFMNGVEQAERELGKARETLKRRETLLRSISQFDSSIERMRGDAEILTTRKDRAARHAEIAKTEQERLGMAEELRRKVDRVRVLITTKEELARRGDGFSQPLKAASVAALGELRAQLEREALLEHEVEEGRAAAATRAPMWRLVAASGLILAGLLGGIFWNRLLLVVSALGAALLVWGLRGWGGARSALPPRDRGKLQELTEKRRAWSGDRTTDEARRLLQEFAGWSVEMRDVATRLEELDTKRSGRADDLLRALDDEYGKVAVELRALAEERAKLEPFKMDAGGLLKIERDMRRLEDDREQAAEARSRMEQELAALPLPDVNEIGERVESARQNLGRAHRSVEVVETILDALGEARREMSGYLAERLPPLAARHLSRITDGRYATLFVDPLTMEIETVPAAGGAAGKDEASCGPARIKPNAVSQGARDQIHLAVRLALLELLSHGDPQPLFLDDPFVHFDPARRDRALELLRDFSQRHQVVIFSCDPFYRAAGPHVIELAR